VRAGGVVDHVATGLLRVRLEADDVVTVLVHGVEERGLTGSLGFGRARDPFVASETGKPLMASNIRQRVLAKVVAEGE
jgi:hypothetical protein